MKMIVTYQGKKKKESRWIYMTFPAPHKKNIRKFLERVKKTGVEVKLFKIGV